MKTKQTLQVGDSAGRKLCPDLPYKKDKQRHIITPRLPDRHKGRLGVFAWFGRKDAYKDPVAIDPFFFPLSLSILSIKDL
jgi:hypothetical protein